MPRLFVAVWPPDDVILALRTLPRPEVPGLRWTTPDQWHVTLRFLGAIDDVAAVTGAVADIAPRVSACEADLGPAVARFGRKVLQVPVAGLDAVAEAVLDATRGLGHPPEDRPFRGHVTLARVRERARVDLRPLCGAPVSATWSVDELCVVESQLHPRGARYQVVERFPLG